MAVSVLTQGASGSNSGSYNTGSISPTANRLVVAIPYSTGASGVFEAPTGLSGAGLTWVKIGEALAGANVNERQLSAWGALSGGSPSSGAVTISFAGTQNNCGWLIFETDAFNPSALDVASLIVQFAAGTPASTATPSVTLAAFADAVNNLCVSAFVTPVTTTFTAGSGSQVGSTVDGTSPPTTMGVQVLTGEDTAPDCTFGGSGLCQGLAFEIDAGSGGGGGVAVPVFEHLYRQFRR